MATTEPLTETPSLRDRVQSLRLPGKVDDPRRRGGGGWLPWALCLLLAAATASLAGRVYTGQVPAGKPGEAAPASASGPAAKDAPAAPAPVATAAGGTVLESKGYIIAAHLIQVSPIEVGGRVVELTVEEGKRFKTGEILAALDKTPYEAEVAEARGSLTAAEQRHLELQRGFRKEEKEQSEAELREAREQLRQADLAFRRAKELRGSALAAQEYEQAEYAYRALEQRVQRLSKASELMVIGPREERIAAAKAEVQQAQARLRKAEWHLDNCTIRSPLNGTVLTKYAELGNLVNPLAFGGSSKAVCDMADLSDLEVELDVTERDVSKVHKGMPCKVRAEAYPDRVYDGVVDRLMPIANRAKGAVPVRVKVRVPKDEEGVYLKPEMGAVVSFLQPGK